MAGYILIATAGQLPELFVGRLMTGLAAGVVSVATPLYLTEVSPPVRRHSALFHISTVHVAM